MLNSFLVSFSLSPSPSSHSALTFLLSYQQLAHCSHTEIFEDKHYDFEPSSAKVLLSACLGKEFQANDYFCQASSANCKQVPTCCVLCASLPPCVHFSSKPPLSSLAVQQQKPAEQLWFCCHGRRGEIRSSSWPWCALRSCAAAKHDSVRIGK